MATEVSRLRMTFLTTLGNRRSISIVNPVENPDSAVVEGVMDTILAKDIFTLPGSVGQFDTKAGAVVVTTATEEIWPAGV